MEKSSNFATDLTFGEQSEQWVKDIFCQTDGTIEVKTERDIWLTTGNICFEIESRGKPSGLMTSIATQWIEVFKSGNKFISAMIFETKMLREWVLRGNFEKKRGGDNNTSVLLIVPIKDLFNFYTKEFQMAKIGISISIDVTKIDKTRLFHGKKGIYMDLTTFIDTTNPDQYDQHGFISQTVNKEEREQGIKSPILGNCKVFFDTSKDNTPAPEQTPVAEFNDAIPSGDDSDLPF